jgi:hypothetical protein
MLVFTVEWGSKEPDSEREYIIIGYAIGKKRQAKDVEIE